MKQTLFIILSLLIVCLPLLAQEQIATPPTWAKQFPASEMNLELRYSVEMQRLYFSLRASASKADIDNFSLNGFFLPSDARIQGLWINDQPSRFLFVSNLKPENFNPPLEDDKLLAKNSTARYHILMMNDFLQYPDDVKVRVDYYLNMPAFKSNTLGQLYTVLGADSFWYPRNLSKQTKINFKLVTTPHLRLTLGDAMVPFTDMDYKREHKANFTDSPTEPLAFRLTKD